MTTFFISRHPGAVEWAARQRLTIDHVVPHLDPARVQPGDTVIGSLPVNLAAQVCAGGAAYWHLTLELSTELRGKELSADDLETLGARVEAFDIQALTPRESELRQAQAIVARYVPPGYSLADELIADRRAENARDELE